jgi:hypothetical protein
MDENQLRRTFDQAFREIASRGGHSGVVYGDDLIIMVKPRLIVLAVRHGRPLPETFSANEAIALAKVHFGSLIPVVVCYAGHPILREGLDAYFGDAVVAGDIDRAEAVAELALELEQEARATDNPEGGFRVIPRPEMFQ